MKLEYATLGSEIKRVGDGTYEFVMNEETVDRDGEIIELAGWDTAQFKENSILLFGHRHDIPGIGVVAKVVKGKNPKTGNPALIAKGVRFASPGIYDLADVVHGLVDDEVIKATSVGFQALERQYLNEENRSKEDAKMGVRVRTKKASLYELSIVNVGAHPAALRIKSAVEKAEFDFKDKNIDAENKSFVEKLLSGEAEDIDADDVKPYPNEHACRLLQPIDGALTRSGSRKHEGKTFRIIFQKQKDGTWSEQAYRYPKETWNPTQARVHCEAHEGIQFEPANTEENSIEVLYEELLERIEKIVGDVVKKAIETVTQQRKNKPRRLYEDLLAIDPSKGRSNSPEGEGPSKGLDDLADEESFVEKLPKAEPIRFLQGEEE